MPSSSSYYLATPPGSPGPAARAPSMVATGSFFWLVNPPKAEPKRAPPPAPPPGPEKPPPPPGLLEAERVRGMVRSVYLLRDAESDPGRREAQGRLIEKAEKELRRIGDLLRATLQRLPATAPGRPGGRRNNLPWGVQEASRIRGMLKALHELNAAGPYARRLGPQVGEAGRAIRALREQVLAASRELLPPAR